jgi:hypothetical protein
MNSVDGINRISRISGMMVECRISSCRSAKSCHSVNNTAGRPRASWAGRLVRISGCWDFAERLAGEADFLAIVAPGRYNTASLRANSLLRRRCAKVKHPFPHPESSA